VTDEELMTAPELKTIAKHLKAATAAVRKLEARSGRRLTIFVEAEAGPMLTDADRDEGGFKRLNLLTEGGGLVHYFEDARNWACGAR
jgi:hypothetical protein